MHFELDASQAAKLAAWEVEQDAAVLRLQASSKDPFVRTMSEDGIPYYGAIGGSLTYSFTPTSIGVVTKVKNGSTGAEIDLSDYGSW